MKYPKVRGEVHTMRAVCAGASIARYGDGEFKMLKDVGIKNHDAHPVLSRRLREILQQLDQADEEAVLDGYCSRCGQWDTSWCCYDPVED